MKEGLFAAIILSLLTVASVSGALNISSASSVYSRADLNSSPLVLLPVANFTVSPTNVSVNWPTVFDASSSSGGESAISNYTWNFGDGNITTLSARYPTVIHSYAEVVTYNASLKVVNVDGLNASSSQMIKVLPAIGFLEVEPRANVEVNEEFNVSIEIRHLGEEWKFFGAEFTLNYDSTLLQFVGAKEGSFLPAFNRTGSPPYTFTTATQKYVGNSSVRVDVVLLGSGAEPAGYIYPKGEGTIVKVTFRTTNNVETGTAYPIPFSISDVMFGNYSGMEIPHYDSVGAPYRIRIDPPVPEFTYAPINQQLGQTITFNASASYITSPFGGAITNYVWDFGDGSNGTGVVATHVYKDPGTFNVTLTVTDTNNNSRSVSKELNFSTWTLTVDVDAGTLYFRGEIAQFYILTLVSGAPANVDKVTAEIYYGDHIADLSSLVTQITTGFYMVKYTIPSNVSVGTWPILATAQYDSVIGVGEKSFEISSTLTQWHAQLISIEGNISTIKTDLGLIQTNLTSLNAHLISVNGSVATIQTNLGEVQADVKSINATVTSINGGVATITSDVGTIQSRLPTSTDTIASLLYIAIILAVIAIIVALLVCLGYGRKKS